MTELMRIKQEAVTTLTDVLISTGRLPPRWHVHTEPTGYTCDLDTIRQLATRAANFIPLEKMDGWFAPRLHSALRIPRRIACDDGVWSWLAFQCKDFIEARFKKGKATVHPWRYRGAWSRNGLARLWWGAEMTRNGKDYSAVELCFARTRTAQFALELMYSLDRGAAIAFVNVVEGTDGGARLSDSQMKRLSTRLRVYLALRSLDSMGLDGTEDTEEFDAEWASHRPSITSLTTSTVYDLVGPASGTCAAARVGELGVWFRQIADEMSLELESDSLDDEEQEGSRYEPAAAG